MTTVDNSLDFSVHRQAKSTLSPKQAISQKFEHACLNFLTSFSKTFWSKGVWNLFRRHMHFFTEALFYIRFMEKLDQVVKESSHQVASIQHMGTPTIVLKELQTGPREIGWKNARRLQSCNLGKGRLLWRTENIRFDLLNFLWPLHNSHSSSCAICRLMTLLLYTVQIGE